MQPIRSFYSSIENKIDNGYKHVGQFLDKNPTIYKAVLVASHFFRMISMFGLMMWLPVPLPATAALMIGGTLLYRAAVERFCCFRFAIPSMIGAGAAWVAKASIVKLIAGTALLSVGAATANIAALVPLAVYGLWVLYSSNEDIKKRMALLQGEMKPSCCSPKEERPSCSSLPEKKLSCCKTESTKKSS